MRHELFQIDPRFFAEEKRPRRKLTDRDVEQARKQNQSQRTLANFYGVSQSTISKSLRRGN